MIFTGGNENRLNYRVSKVLETDNSVIINGETYDKTTLFKISDFLVEYGLCFGLASYEKMFQTSWFQSSVQGAMTSTSTSFATDYLTDSNKCGGAISVVDNKNPDIIHTIAGETAIKLNTNTMKYTISRNAFCCYNSVFLHQDDDYIYFLTMYCNDKGCSGTAYYIIYNKNTMVMNYDKSYGTANTPYSIQVINRVDNYAYISLDNVGTFTFYKVSCADGKITATATTLPVAVVAGTAAAAKLNVIPSAVDSNGVFYALTNLNKLSYYKFNGQDIVDSGSVDDMFVDGSSVKVDDFLKEKYGLDSIDEAGRKSYLSMMLNYDGSASGVPGRLWECMLMDDGKYLVIQHSNRNCYITANDRHWLACFKRNDPDNPLDLTLTDFKRFSEISNNNNNYRAFKKVSEDILSAVSANQVFELKLVNGKFVEQPKVIMNLLGFGYDRAGRYYYTTSLDNYLNVDSDSSASAIELQYANTGDGYVRFGGETVVREVVVRTKNVNGTLVNAHFELTSTSAKFSNNATKIQGQTGVTGETRVPITFTGVYDTVVTGRIVYENEL